tara:strand:- start:1130 stop:1459 length:330 start_codon:yes stop_codon:yes gene_type:complete
MKYFKKILILTFVLFSFSCEDLSKISEEMKDLKNNQNLIMQKQSEVLKKLALLDTKVGKANTADNSKNKKNKKRKGPNPDFKHNIDIGNSVVLGNPDAKVTVTKFTDFQ